MSSFQPTGETWRPTTAATGPRGSFWQRLWADLIDGIVLLVAWALIAGITKLPGNRSSSPRPSPTARSSKAECGDRPWASAR
jgi:hypothetical protein